MSEEITEKEAAQNIKEATNELNRAIAKASEMGIETEIDKSSLTRFCDGVVRSHVGVTITKKM